MRQADLLQPVLTEETPPIERLAEISVIGGSADKERGNRARFTAADIEALKATLMAAADARAGWSPAQSKQAVIKTIYPVIQLLRKRGSSMEEIASILRGGGMPIAEGTLRGYVLKARPPRAAKRPRAQVPLPQAQTTTVQPSEMAPQFDVESL